MPRTTSNNSGSPVEPADLSAASPEAELSAAIPWLALGLGLQVMLATFFVTAPVEVTGGVRGAAKAASLAAAVWPALLCLVAATGLLRGRVGAWAAVTAVVIVRALGWVCELLLAAVPMVTGAMDPNQRAFYLIGFLLTAGVPAVLTAAFGAALWRSGRLFGVLSPVRQLLRNGWWIFGLSLLLEVARLWIIASGRMGR